MSFQVLCLGEALVDLIAKKPSNSLQDANDFVMEPGGAVCNVAIGLARLGVNVGLIAKLGDDPFGRFMLARLKKFGVQTSACVITKDYLTAVVFITLDEERKPSFFFYGKNSADQMLSQEDIKARYFRGIKIFHFGTISLSKEPSRTATFRALELATKHRALISADLNFRFHLWEDLNELKKITIELLDCLDIVKLNQEELKFLTGTKNLGKGAKRILKAHPQLVVVTLGKKGAYFASRKLAGLVPGFGIKPVDTTGAGDAFASALLYKILCHGKIPKEKEDIEDALRFANAFAGLSTKKLGAVRGLPQMAQVKNFLSRQTGY